MVASGRPVAAMKSAISTNKIAWPASSRVAEGPLNRNPRRYLVER